ncbi:MAG: Asp-tRNA(Asn)/Glu-tRNA(Gln) amidotransferase subunit GatB [Deltaproteobacteria bacterium]|nr:Asp-tRNA(Asn)/Glu-tRNA(Gln) amidotransferase subunit GatB [Deltaproteobacteria bacterium]MBI3293639.1 Asp-tRNA(Asn)/Glu-tRNA(Gln) amidotransferase subunit GatB [Deltaproteobacteria bacterium]
MSARDKYEAVIGLEVHAQLLTSSKMFCSCPNVFGAEPNTKICPVCTGQPGALPVVNRHAIELGVRVGLALNSTIHPVSIFARKNYFYPDLPKGYQISQYEQPFCTGGEVPIQLKDGTQRGVKLTRIHFEEDVGKSTHHGHGTRVDLNRACVPLIEMVSEPDMRTAFEAGQYLRALRNILRYTQVCDGNLEEGNFRCDANISVRLKGAQEFGTKVELKNINSFRYVEKAIDYEIDRQVEMIELGEVIQQQTRGWNAAKGTTELMRLKEGAADYRYFPEPDLAPLEITTDWQNEIRKQLPELPQQKSERFQESYGLSPYDASVLTAAQELAQYFETVTNLSQNAKASANWVMNELLGRLNAASVEIDQSPVSTEHLADLIRRIDSNEISGKIAKTVFEAMFATAKAPETILNEKGLRQISDAKQLEKVIQKVIEANTSQVVEYKNGKTKLLGFFVGQVMKETKGQANPGVLNELVKKLLDSQ